MNPASSLLASVSWHNALLVLILALASPRAARAGEPAQTVTLEFASLDNAPQTAAAEAVLKAAYARLGVGFNVHVLPLRRGIQMVDAGELDGDLVHSAVSLDEWQRLVVVKVPLGRASFMAYQSGQSCPSHVSVDELIEGRVAYMRGTRGLEFLFPEAARVASNNNWDALRAMRQGLTRYAVTGQMDSDLQLARHGVHDVCKVREPVLSVDLFHSLNQRHAELAQRLERVLEEMRKRGEIARIGDEQARLAHKLAHAHPGAPRP